MGDLLSYANQPLSLKTCISNPDMKGRTVLVNNRWDYVRHHLNSLPRGKRKNIEDILFYWNQAEEFFNSSKNLSAISRPLPLYYSFLNATKALLLFKNGEIKNEYHGVSGFSNCDKSRSNTCSLNNEITQMKPKGVCPEFASFLGDNVNIEEYSLDQLLFNLVFLHEPIS